MKFKIIGLGSLCSFLERLCVVLLVLGGGVVAFLPWLLDFFYRWRRYAHPETVRGPMLAALYVSGVSAFIILWLLRKLLHNVNGEDPFTAQNAKMLKAIGWLCLPVAGIYLAVLPFLSSVLVLCVALAFAFIAALIAVLAELFTRAVRYKEENDLTI